MRYFVHDQETPGTFGSFDDPVMASPDGRYFFFVMRHGELSTDSNVYELQVFASADVAALLKKAQGRRGVAQPLQRVTFRSMRSGMFYQGISEAHWSDSARIEFIGVQDSGPRQAYQLDVSSGVLKRQSDEQHDVGPILTQSESVLYGSMTVDFKPEAALKVYPMAPVKDDELRLWPGPSDTSYHLYGSYRGGNVQSLSSSRFPSEGYSLSPNGRYAVVVRFPADEMVRQRWTKYELAVDERRGRGAQFVLIDLKTGNGRAFFDAPTGRSTQAGLRTPLRSLWSPDSRHVILVNTALPFADGRVERRDTPYIVDYAVDADRWAVIGPLLQPASSSETAGQEDPRFVSSAIWVEPGRTFVTREAEIRAGDEYVPFGGVTYTLQGNQWVARRSRSPSELPAPVQSPKPHVRGVTVAVRQSANDPPVAVASNAAGEIALTGPDPALDGLWRARLEPVQWTEADGSVTTGGLMLPPDHAPGQRVPLVIQAYYNTLELFLPDGPHTTAYAAQPLVGQGMAVLNIDIPGADVALKQASREGPMFVERIDAAVAELARRELIDSDRVGLVGFSRAGFLAYYAVTHPRRVTLAAAVDADGWTGSYGERVLIAATSRASETHPFFKTQYGGEFWQSKAAWLEASPSFNVDRARTPVLFTVQDDGAPGPSLQQFETIGAFRINRRPFEFLVFRDGAHSLQRPLEREASMQATVDWMTFWLQGRAGSSTDRSERFTRWRAIQAEWQKTKSREGITKSVASSSSVVAP